MEFLQPTFLLAMLIALSVHECAHAFAAYKLGDDTARLSGRLTLNPLSHLDPLGTLMFVIVGFGWGKPVPVNPNNFEHPIRGSAITALAGPLSNLILAFLSFVILGLTMHVLPGADDVMMLGRGAYEGSIFTRFVVDFFQTSLFVNLALMAFNLIPIAPLDGSKILQAFIPASAEDTYDAYLHYGPYILLAIIVGERLIGFDFLTPWISTIINWVLTAFTALAHMVGL